jgi:uroporphyrinogen decarboxylase
MVTTPDLVVDVSLLPLNVIDVDAIIFFSDILTLPYGLGIDIQMKESIGPVVTQPLSSVESFQQFSQFSAAKHVPYVGQALSTLRKKVPAEKALIGFCGAPWTVTSYLVEGRGKTDFSGVKRWLEQDEKAATQCLELLTEATLNYLDFQIKSGVDIIQVFDTWLSRMPAEFFAKYYIPLLNTIFDEVKARGSRVIYFAKGIAPYLSHFSKLRADVLSIDNDLDLIEVDRITGGKYSLQGNLDPNILFLSEGEVRQKTRKLVDTARKLSRPPILNLGHGILPKTPVANAKAFIEEARSLWV